MKIRTPLAGLALAASLAGGAVGITTLGASAGAQDTTTTTVVADASGPQADRPDPGTRLAEVLKPLVDDGTLTQDQLDKVIETLKAAGPPEGHGRNGGGHHRGPKLDAVATALGVSVDDLRTELQSGKTIAEVAGAKGVDVKVVVDAISAEMNAHIDQGVTDGRLTADEAATRKAETTQRATDLVNGVRPAGRPEGGPDRGRGGPGGPASDASTDTTSAGTPATGNGGN